MTLNWQYDSRRIWLTGTLMLLLICCPWIVAETEITLGPYDSMEDLAKITDFLDANAIPFDSNQDAVMESLGFIVVTEQLSPASASITIAELQDQQVEDLLYIKAGVYVNRISAGVFGTIENADNRAAELSHYGFSVLERTRTLSPASIKVFRADIAPALEEEFQAITGVWLPPARLVTDVKKAIVEQTEPEPQPEPEPEPEPKLDPVPAVMPTVKSIESVASVESEKRVTTVQFSEKETFPFIPFLLIATFVVIVIGLGYYYLSRRSGQPIMVQLETAKEPQQIPLYQEVIGQAHRQLDSSIGAISAYANQLLGGQSPTTEEVPQYIATIRSGGIEVLDLISDIIDLSRIEIGQVEIERISFDPESALEDLVKSLSQKAELKGISLHFEPDENLPSLVAADPAKLEKILSILVSYAIENTESGRVLITATFLSQLDSLKITIKHTSESFDSLIISEMFEPIESTSGINSEQRLRFAVSKRLAKLMGGDIQIMSQSDHDIEYVVTVQADEILKKQLLLPSGVSIDELVQSEAEARELADNAQLALVAAQTETQQATQAHSEAESKLALEMEAKTSAEARAEADSTARIEAESRAAELTVIRDEIESRSDETVAELQAALERATIDIQVEARARKYTIQRARERIANLSMQLAEAEATREEFSMRLQTQETTETEVDELRTALIDAKARLEQEIDLHSTADVESESQIKTLREQLNDARAVSEQESSSKVELEDRLGQLTTELEETRQVLQTQLAASQQQASVIQLKADKLAEELVETRTTAEQNKKERNEIAENSRVQVETLQEVLDIARRQAIEEAKQKEESLNASRNELNTLRDQLSNAETSLANNLALEQESANKLKQEVETLKAQLVIAQQQTTDEAGQREESLNASRNGLDIVRDQLSHAEASLANKVTLQQEAGNELQLEVDSLKTALALTEEKLAGEAEAPLANNLAPKQASGNELQNEVDSLRTTLALTEEKLAGEAESRNRIEQNSGNQIESLIDEVNQARAAARREAETRVEIEKETQRKIDSIAAELSEAQTALKADANAGVELDQAARAEAKQNAEAEQAAKQEQELEQLVASAEAASPDPVSSDASLTEEDDTPIHSSKEAEEKTSGYQIESLVDEVNRAKAAAKLEAEAGYEKALHEARAEAKQNAEAEQAARQELEQLVASARAASPDPVSSDASLMQEDHTPIHSSKDMSNPILRSMVQRFIVRLSQHLDAMDTALQQQNYLRLVVIGNWIKNESFSLAFTEFEPVTSALELSLRQKDFDSIHDIVSQLRKLGMRIEIQDIPVDDGSSLGVKPQSIEDIKIPLPADEKKTELLENFVSQLGSKLLEMQSAWDYGNSSELEKACRWILRYAAKLQLPVVISATEELQSAIKHADADRISQKLWNFIGLYSHLELERKL